MAGTTKTRTISAEDLQFIQEHIHNFEAIRLGYSRNMGMDILSRYEQIYHTYIDAGYILTYWCQGCIYEMMERLVHFYDRVSMDIADAPKEEPAPAPAISKAKSSSSKKKK